MITRDSLFKLCSPDIKKSKKEIVDKLITTLIIPAINA